MPTKIKQKTYWHLANSPVDHNNSLHKGAQGGAQGVAQGGDVAGKNQILGAATIDPPATTTFLPPRDLQDFASNTVAIYVIPLVFHEFCWEPMEPLWGSYSEFGLSFMI